jgi:hypothetical protein
MGIEDKILIGLANANPRYGVQPRGRLTAQILQDIWGLGVTRVDSAADYIHAAEIISQSNLSWGIQTKFKLPETYNSFEILLQAAQLAIGPSQVDSLLVHTPNLYQQSRADQVVFDLKRISEVLEIPQIGISIYRPEELENLKNWKDLDLVQFPHNPLDSNCFDWLTSLDQTNLPILQVRSIYLQGLLIPQISKSAVLPSELSEALSDWEHWILENNLDAQIYCATFACGNPKIDEIVVGVDSSEQLRQLVKNVVDIKDLPRYPKTIPAQFTDPRRWTH